MHGGDSTLVRYSWITNSRSSAHLFHTLQILMGSTICTLPETILIQIVYFFHVFCVSLVLILLDPHVSGVQGGAIFSDLVFFFLLTVLYTNMYTTISRILFKRCSKSYSGSFVISLSSSVLQRLSAVTLYFPAFLSEFSSSLQCHAEVVSWTAGERGPLIFLAWTVLYHFTTIYFELDLPPSVCGDTVCPRVFSSNKLYKST